MKGNMKRTAILLAVLALISFAAKSQESLNSNPDSILGTFLVPEKGNDSKVKFTKNPDGTYDCAIVWMEAAIDPSTGKVWCDVKNPDKSLRSRSCMGLKLITGLKYDASKKCWGGAKIYDPNRGITANVKIVFSQDGKLVVRGSVLGIGETVYWTRTK